MDGVLVGQLDDFVALHDISADAGKARVRLVINKDVTAVICPVGKGHMGMMTVAVHPDAEPILEPLARLRQQAFGHDLTALIGEAPARRTAAVEHGDAHQFTHRRQADDSDLASLSAGEEDVVFVEFAGRDLYLLAPCTNRIFGARLCSSRFWRNDSTETETPRKPCCADGGSPYHLAAADRVLLLVV